MIVILYGSCFLMAIIGVDNSHSVVKFTSAQPHLMNVYIMDSGKLTDTNAQTEPQVSLTYTIGGQRRSFPTAYRFLIVRSNFFPIHSTTLLLEDAYNRMVMLFVF